MGVFWGGGRALVSTDALTAPVAGSHAHPAAPSSGCPRPPPAADTAARDQRRLNADAAHPVTTIRCVRYATAKAAATDRKPPGRVLVAIAQPPKEHADDATTDTAGRARARARRFRARVACARPPVFVLDGIDVVRTGKGLQLVTLPTSVGDFEMEDSDGRFEYWRANMVDVDEDFAVGAPVVAGPDAANCLVSQRPWQPGLPGLGATDPLFSHRRVADCAVRPGRCT